MLAGIGRALGGVTENFCATHGVAHEEERDRARNSSAEERGDVREHARSRASKAFFGGFVNGATPSPATRILVSYTPQI